MPILDGTKGKAMGLFSNVVAFVLGRTAKPSGPAEDRERYGPMSAAELKDLAMAGDREAEAELRHRAAAAGK